MRHFFLLQKRGNHANHLAAVRQHRIGHGAHQANIAAAIHQGVAVVGQGLPQRLRCGKKGRIFAPIGAAIDHDIVEFIHNILKFIVLSGSLKAHPTM